MVKSLWIVIKEKGHGNEVDQRMYVFLASFPKDNEYISFYLSLFSSTLLARAQNACQQL